MEIITAGFFIVIVSYLVAILGISVYNVIICQDIVSAGFAIVCAGLLIYIFVFQLDHVQALFIRAFG